MKLIETDQNSQLVISMSVDELRALSGIMLEVLSGSLKVSDTEWEAALLPVTKDEARVIKNNLIEITRTQR